MADTWSEITGLKVSFNSTRIGTAVTCFADGRVGCSRRRRECLLTSAVGRDGTRWLMVKQSAWPAFELTRTDDVVLCVSDDEEVQSNNNKYSRSQVLQQ